MTNNLSTGYTFVTTSGRYKCLDDIQRTSMDFHLSYCGWEYCAPKHSFGPLKRTEYVLHYITKGKGYFEVNGKHYDLKKDNVFLIAPDEETYYQADEEDPWHYFWVGFNGLRARECMNDLGLTVEQPVNSYSCGDKLFELLQKMLDAHQLTFSNELLRTAYLLEFFSVLIKDWNDNTGKDSRPRAKDKDYSSDMYVWYAIEYMKHHYSEKIKINDVANYVGINRGYLTSSFKKTIQMSPQDYLLNLRMNKAASLLKDTTLSIHTIANQVGYEDPLAFSKRFKQSFQLSPSQFRETRPQLIFGTVKKDFANNLPL